MTTTVNGITIKLTPEQVSFIQQKQKEIIENATSFATVFNQFGFSNAGDNKSFHHETNGWYAEIITDQYFTYVWMVGKGLKCSKGFPGGWTYESPSKVAEALSQANLN